MYNAFTSFIRTSSSSLQILHVSALKYSNNINNKLTFASSIILTSLGLKLGLSVNDLKCQYSHSIASFAQFSNFINPSLSLPQTSLKAFLKS